MSSGSSQSTDQRMSASLVPPHKAPAQSNQFLVHFCILLNCAWNLRQVFLHSTARTYLITLDVGILRFND